MLCKERNLDQFTSRFGGRQNEIKKWLEGNTDRLSPEMGDMINFPRLPEDREKSQYIFPNDFKEVVCQRLG